MEFPISADLVQYPLMLGAWVIAFLLGRELHVGFTRWRSGRRKR